MSSVNKTPAVSPASTPSWDPFGNNQPAANANNQGIILNRRFFLNMLCW